MANQETARAALLINEEVSEPVTPLLDRHSLQRAHRSEVALLPDGDVIPFEQELFPPTSTTFSATATDVNGSFSNPLPSASTALNNGIEAGTQSVTSKLEISNNWYQAQTEAVQAQSIVDATTAGLLGKGFASAEKAFELYNNELIALATYHAFRDNNLDIVATLSAEGAPSAGVVSLQNGIGSSTPGLAASGQLGEEAQSNVFARMGGGGNGGYLGYAALLGSQLEGAYSYSQTLSYYGNSFVQDAQNEVQWQGGFAGFGLQIAESLGVDAAIRNAEPNYYPEASVRPVV